MEPYTQFHHQWQIHGKHVMGVLTAHHTLQHFNFLVNFTATISCHLVLNIHCRSAECMANDLYMRMNKLQDELD